MSREVQVSKKISWLLRHGAEKEGLKLGAGGYALVSEVVSLNIVTFHRLSQKACSPKILKHERSMRKSKEINNENPQPTTYNPSSTIPEPPLD